MRVLVVHNRYRSDQPSGENQVVEDEIDGLRALGVDVMTYLRSSDEIAGMSPARRLTVPLQPLHGRQAIGELTALLRDRPPDVLHLHNPFPLVSWSVVHVAHAHGVPVVVTAHNHRHSCLRGTYFRDGQRCELCRGRTLPWPGVVHGCYRDSHLQSVPMAAAFALHRGDQRAVDRYLALTQDGADSLLASGLVRPAQVTIRPNSVPDPGPVADKGSGLLFVGRLTSEKGVLDLIEAWDRSNRPFGTLTVVGDGALRESVEAVASRPGSGVVSPGRLDRAGVSAALRASEAVVVPSASTEGLPLVVLEAFAHGRPVLTTRATGLDRVVTPEVGLVVGGGPEDLAAGLIELARADTARLGARARDVYESAYSPAVVLRAQVQVYEEVIAARRRS